MSLIAPATTRVVRASGSRLRIEWEMPETELLTAYHFRIYAQEHDESGRTLHQWSVARRLTPALAHG